MHGAFGRNLCTLRVSPKKCTQWMKKRTGHTPVAYLGANLRRNHSLPIFQLNKLPCRNFKQSSYLAPRFGNSERCFKFRQFITEPPNSSFCYQLPFLAASFG
eukprot:s568_g29.t1